MDFVVLVFYICTQKSAACDYGEMKKGHCFTPCSFTTLFSLIFVFVCDSVKFDPLLATHWGNGSLSKGMCECGKESKIK